MAGFVRRIEDFVCLKCGTEVTGDGYTNHCPRCLWSLHMDIDPGDRAAECGGPMEPVGIEVGSSGYVLIHRCVRCCVIKRNRSHARDDHDALVDLARRVSGSDPRRVQ